MSDSGAQQGGGSPSPESPQNMVDQIVEVFFQYSRQFIEALCEVWPECNELKRYKLKFELACVHPPASIAIAAKREMVLNYHKTMSPHYQRCTQKDDSLLLDRAAQQGIDILNDIQFYNKWTPDLHPETKENVWEYLCNMNRYSNLYSLYSSVPAGMMGKIENMASGIATKMESGQMSMQDLNLQELGHTVMQNMDKQDMEAFAGNMAGNMGNLQSMYGMLGSMLNTMPPPGTAAAPAAPPVSQDNERHDQDHQE